MGFVVHKLRVGQDFPQALQFPLPGLFNHCSLFIFIQTLPMCGARGGVMVKALRYKPAGRGFDSR